MKVIIAGSRHMQFKDYPLISRAAARFTELTGQMITEEVCGEARGADIFGKKWAICEAGIPVKSFPADWDTYGKGAGPIRNREMAEYADGLIVFIWDNSRGSANMLEQIQQTSKPWLAIWNGEYEEYGNMPVEEK